MNAGLVLRIVALLDDLTHSEVGAVRHDCDHKSRRDCAACQIEKLRAEVAEAEGLPPR